MLGISYFWGCFFVLFFMFGHWNCNDLWVYMSISGTKFETPDYIEDYLLKYTTTNIWNKKKSLFVAKSGTQYRDSIFPTSDLISLIIPHLIHGFFPSIHRMVDIISRHESQYISPKIKQMAASWPQLSILRFNSLNRLVAAAWRQLIIVTLHLTGTSVVMSHRVMLVLHLHSKHVFTLFMFAWTAERKGKHFAFM